MSTLRRRRGPTTASCVKSLPSWHRMPEVRSQPHQSKFSHGEISLSSRSVLNSLASGHRAMCLRNADRGATKQGAANDVTSLPDLLPCKPKVVIRNAVLLPGRDVTSLADSLGSSRL
jgi:hypothetical protein